MASAEKPIRNDGDGAKTAVPLTTFRHPLVEVGFCFTIAMTQFLTEYLISGFAIELLDLKSNRQADGYALQSTRVFWPASLLSLILSATMLTFARISDIYGGYGPFMFGVSWLTLWTLIPGFCKSILILNVSRAMQGLAIAALMPSTFTMIGTIYPGGPRRNLVLGLYSGCAPLGFFGGLFMAAVLPAGYSSWYFWTASALSGISIMTAFLTVQPDRIDRRELTLTMDWIGSFLITSGLILVSYALAVEPYVESSRADASGFSAVTVLVPLISGICCLVIAFWYEGWRAACPLLPFDFFEPKGVKALSLACLCFYATYGVWLYAAAEYFQDPRAVSNRHNGALTGIDLAIWYIPTAVGGITLCVGGAMLLRFLPMMSLLLVSAAAWVTAPTLLAVAPLPLEYWKYVFPSMLCATLGIDLTFTVCIVFISSIQPLRYQGLSGAFCSMLVNIAISAALSIAEIVRRKVVKNFEAANVDLPFLGAEEQEGIMGYKAMFLYGAASAALGLLICAIFVRLPRANAEIQQTEKASVHSNTSDSTLSNVEGVA